MKLLDCTLRDGGYYTNWNFNTEMVRDLVTNLDLAQIDIIELGYKSPVKGGKFRKCNDRFIWEVLDYTPPVHSKLAFMIDAKDFIKNQEVDYSLIDDVIHNQSSSPFSICRLAIKHNEINLAKTIGRYIQSKGYDLIVNLMSISTLNEKEITKFGSMAELNPLALYFADSYGNLEPEKVKELVDTFKTFGYEVGIHTHDNLGLAFANSLSAIKSGATFIDGTLLGMGRGVGNAKTEQLVTYHQHTIQKYNVNPLQKLITKWMEPLKEVYRWGFTHNYMVSGLKHIHPLYPQYLQNSFLHPNEIENVLLNLEDSSTFDKNKINMEPKVAVVIPARYKSTRLPGKPLVKLKGKEMIVRVAEIAEKAVGKENVYVATENEEIVNVVKGYGFKVILTSDGCMTGTDRVAEAALEIDADVIINVQGDEPLLDPNDIIRIKEAKIKYPNHIVNCVAPLNQYETADNRKLAKVVANLDNEMMYISRSPIPGTKAGFDSNAKKQVSIYGFNKEHLKAFTSVKDKTPVEFQEDIEIIRFLELGYKIKLVEVKGDSYSVDYPEDIKIVENLL